jgi:hypothetical protein
VDPLYNLKKAFLVVALVTIAAAQPPQSPLSDKRLTIHTLLREDIFAGFMMDDMTRFERGEKNIDKLLEMRPDQKGNLLAWKGGATLYRAVKAHENNQPAEFKKLYQQSLDLFAEAAKSPGNDGVAPVTGGSFGVFADRLPKEYQAAGWQTAYNNYQVLYKLQSGIVDKLPVHLKGELLAGVAQSAQRTGRTEEAAQAIDKMLTLLAGTPYEPVAKKWTADPSSAANSSLTCMTCHDAGRLAVRVSDLK